MAAIAQLITRLYMGALMRRIPDRSFLVGSGLMIAISCALLAISPAVVFFVASQLVQGIARAFFWTSSQTHAVRTSAAPVSGLRDVNLAAGGIGALLGPTVAGYLWEASVQLPLMMGGIVAGSVAVVPRGLVDQVSPRSRPGLLHPLAGMSVCGDDPVSTLPAG